MLLRITRKISQKDANRLRVASAKMSAMAKLLAFNFLVKDLNSKFTKDPAAQAALQKQLAYTVLSEVPVGLDPGAEYYVDRNFGKVNFTFPRPTKKVSEQSASYLCLDVLQHFSPISAKLTASLTLQGPAEKTFRFLAFESENQVEEQMRVFDFVNYFCSRKNLYENISAILTKNEEKIKTLTNEAFASDLLSLFSIKEKKAITAFDFSEKLVKKRFYSETFPTRKPEETFLSSFSLSVGPISSIELLLNTENSLLIDFSLSNMDFSKLKIENAFIGIPDEVLTKDVRPDKFLAKNLNTWLKAYVAIADFETEFYEKIKTKILLNSI